MLWQQSPSQVQCAVSGLEQELPIRLLLWAPNGVGLHYNGPGMNAYRLLSNLTPADPLTVSLAHGYPSQSTSDVFAKQHFVAPVNGSIASQAAFIWHGCRWLSRQRGQFDVFYGLQAFDFTVLPAETAREARHSGNRQGRAAQSRSCRQSRMALPVSTSEGRREKVTHLSGIVAISDAIRQELISYGIPDRKIAHIPNGVDTDQFRPPATFAERETLRRQLGWPDETIVLFVGAMTRRKRPHLLIEALGELKARGVRAHLVLAGPDQGRAIWKINEICCTAAGSP